jgi:hypothetical protein
MLVTLSEAARQPGAPSQAALHRMTKNKRLPGFLVQTEDGWRVDVDSADWDRYLKRVSKHAEPQKQVGNQVKRQKKPAGRRDDKKKKEDDEEKTALRVDKAIEAKIIYNAQREKYKMEQDEIKTNALKEIYVDKREAEYWLSFIQRGITDSFSVVKYCMSEVKRHIMMGDDAQAERVLLDALIAAYERTAENLRGVLEGEESGND